MKFTKTVLANGLTVLKVPSREAESVVVDVFVKTGSRSEGEREAGMSHFLEHFLFKGTQKYPSSQAINELVDGIGGDVNAFTGKETTQYYIKAHHLRLGLIFDILTDMVRAPLFDAGELEKEKGVIAEEINMYKDMPRAVAEETLDELMWPGEAIGRPIVGSKEIVYSFTADMFRAYMQRHYQPGNMIIGIAGRFAEREVDQLLARLWQGVKRARGGGFTLARDVQKKSRLKLVYKDTEQAHLALGFKGFSHNDKRNPALSVLSAVLGGGMSSRLWNEIREKRGLAYYVRASSGSFQDTGQFAVTAGVRLESASEALGLIVRELARVSQTLVSEGELLKVKEYLKGKTALALEENLAKLDWYLDQVAFRKRVRTPDEVYRLIDKVTAREVMQVAREIYSRDGLSLAVVGPYKDEKNFSKLLREF